MAVQKNHQDFENYLSKTSHSFGLLVPKILVTYNVFIFLLYGNELRKNYKLGYQAVETVSDFYIIIILLARQEPNVSSTFNLLIVMISVNLGLNKIF